MEEVGKIVLLVAVIVAFFVCIGALTNCSSEDNAVLIPVIIPGPTLECPDHVVEVKCPDAICPTLECPDTCPSFPGNGHGWRKNAEKD